MEEALFEVVYKITAVEVKSEKAAKKEIESFLEKKHLANLGLDLRELIEIAINYTTLNPFSVLNSNFYSFFEKKEEVLEKPTVLKNKEKKVSLDCFKVKKDSDFLDQKKKIINDKYFEFDGFTCGKGKKNSLNFFYKGGVIGRWSQVSYFGSKGERVLGKFDYSDNIKAKQITQDLGIVSYKSYTSHTVTFEQVIQVLDKILFDT